MVEHLRLSRTVRSSWPNMSVTKGGGLISFFVIQAILIQMSHASDDGPACNIVCGRDYNPVCGEYQGVRKTFSNPCMMDYYNCRMGAGFTLLQKNECPEDSKDGMHN